MNSPMITPMIAIVIAIFMPLKIAGQRERKAHHDERLPSRSRQRAAKAQGRGFGAGEADRRRYHDRKEADESRERNSRLAADPEPNDKQRRERDLRNQLKQDQVGVERVSQQG